MAKSFYIIDGHSQIYRAYYAPFRPLTAPGGEPTRATFVFCQMLLNLIRDRRPDYLAVALDADERKLERRRIYPEYKATREPAPEDFAVQEHRILDTLAAAGVPLLRLEGHEADDIMATLVQRHASADLDIFLVSRDKDLDQLLSPRVTLYDPMKDELITPERLVELKGWPPELAIEAQILTGDTVDNVPGVPGIGPKTAAKLLAAYGSAQGVVDHADDLTPKQRANVLGFAPQMALTRTLVTLRRDVPIQFDLQDARTSVFRWSALRPIFSELGFRRLVDQLPSPGDEPAAAADAFDDDHPRAATSATSTAPAPDPAAIETPARPAADDPFAAIAQRLGTPDGGAYRLVNTPEDLAALAAALAAMDEFAVDTETTGVDAIDAELVGLSFAHEAGRGYYVPVRSAYGKALPLELVREVIGPLLADPRRGKVGQNLKYDLLVLTQAGLPVAGPLFDTMIASFVLDATRSSHGLDSLAYHYLGHRMIPITDLIGSGQQQLRMDQVPVEHVAEYASEDADYTWRLKQLFAPQLEARGLESLFYDVEMPLVSVLTQMELHGIGIDTALLEKLSKELSERADALVRDIHAAAGRSFNVDSPKQLAEVLFDQLGFRVVRRTRTTRSTDADTLETLQRETCHPIFGLLLEYREVQKLRGTYVDALPRQRSRRTGRVHTSYHQTGAVTGRLSSSEPNLQNIPIRTEAGRQIRRAFVPRNPDECLIVADYSQVELRVLAHFCEDEALLRAFREDQDIHAFVAAQVNGVPLPEVTKEMRGRAKAVNFGIIYGQTAFGLAQATGMSRTEAQAFIDAYFARYPRIRAFIDQCLAQARRTGEVQTILGRRRPITNLDSRNTAARAQAERVAVNTVIQGSAADLIKLAMIRLHRRIHDDGLPLRMLLQVHDELVCEGPRADAARLSAAIREAMQGAMTLRVPLKVDIATGSNWLDAK